MNITLNNEQARIVAKDFIAHNMIMYKQYLSPDDIKHYKFMLTELCTLTELEQIQQKFNQEYPKEVTWNVFMV